MKTMQTLKDNCGRFGPPVSQYLAIGNTFNINDRKYQ